MPHLLTKHTKKMQQTIYDAVVSDYEMPQKNGLEFLKDSENKITKFRYLVYGKRQRRRGSQSLEFRG